jgi:uncharacterized surface protein with fasciclin (FAS1) repeats
MTKNYFFSSLCAVLLLFSNCLLVSCAKDKGDYSTTGSQLPFDGTIYSYLKSQPGTFDSFLLVIDRLGLTDSVNKQGVTVFAPTNESFKLAVEKYNNGKRAGGSPLTSLSIYDKAFLDTMIRRYIFPGVFKSASMQKTDGVTLLSISGYVMNGKTTYYNAQGFLTGGATSITLSDTRYSLFKTDWISTTANAVDIATTNGVVHVLDAGHIFGFDNFTKERKPFKGVPYVFPAAVNGILLMEAEDYDKGGDGVGFRSPNGRNGGTETISKNYRLDGFTLYSHSAGVTEGVSFPTTLDLQEMSSGHWASYSIDVPAEGDYKIQSRYRMKGTTNETTLMRYHIDFDLVNLTGPVSVTGKDAYPAWSFSTATVHLTKGAHIMRFFFEIPLQINLDAFYITRIN